MREGGRRDGAMQEGLNDIREPTSKGNRERNEEVSVWLNRVKAIVSPCGKLEYHPIR